jgi:hypothetical protein
VGTRGLIERWPLARSESGIAPGCDKGGCGALRSLGGSSLVRVITSTLFSKGLFTGPVNVLILNKHSLEKNVAADPNCTVLKLAR